MAISTDVQNALDLISSDLEDHKVYVQGQLNVLHAEVFKPGIFKRATKGVKNLASKAANIFRSSKENVKDAVNTVKDEIKVDIAEAETSEAKA